MPPPDQLCLDPARRRAAVTHHKQGLDAVRVSPADRTSCAVVLLLPPKDVAPGSGYPADTFAQKAGFRLVVEGGRRVTGVRPRWVEVETGPDGRPRLRVTFNKAGDDGPYTLVATDPADATKSPADFDPALTRLAFRFAPTAGDCAPPACPDPPPPPPPPIDYLAKDYAGFRRLMLDRLSQTVPGWAERRAADLGVTVIEALAYAADHLSYAQDAVATEAYLETARLRVSVRRHARLIDYRMHDGCAARAWVQLQVSAALSADDVKGLAFFTEPGGPARRGGHPAVVRRDDLSAAGGRDRVVFEPVAGPLEARLEPSQNRIRFYTWGDGECCLPAGAVGASLAWNDDWGADPAKRDTWKGPRVGDLLLIEEEFGARTGLEADADPDHRHVVRLTRVAWTPDYPPGAPAPEEAEEAEEAEAKEPEAKAKEEAKEPEAKAKEPVPVPVSVLEVGWDRADAVPFPVCVSTRGRTDVSVARGNVLLVDHGLTVVRTEPLEPTFAAGTAEPGPCAAGHALHGPPGRAAAARRFGEAEFRPPLLAPLTRVAPFPDAVIQARYQARWLARLPVPKPTAAPTELVQLALGGAVVLPKSVDGAAWADVAAVVGPAKFDLAPDARAAAAALELFEVPPGGKTVADFVRELRANLLVPAADPADLVRWTARTDLLDSGPTDRHFVVEGTDDGSALVRFGDGHAGRRPAPKAAFVVRYRVGNGTAGNVAAGTIAGVVGPGSDVILGVWNPLPASGGTDPEPVARVKLVAPTAFRTDLARAITADDYARLAERDDRVQRAAAVFRRTPTGTLVRVALDLRAGVTTGAADDRAEVRRVGAEVAAYLNRFRRIGHDVRVAAAATVPLVVKVGVWAAPHADPERVAAAVRAEFAPGRLPDGRRGFFDPDELSFGQRIDASDLVARARAVPGVAAVKVVSLRRRTGPPAEAAPTGFLRVGPLEIPRVDADAVFPEFGELVVEPWGGGR